MNLSSSGDVPRRSQRPFSRPHQQTRQLRAAPVGAVEHVQVGAYRFPLYSHPLFRVRLAEDAYVARRVQSCLRDPAVYAALDNMVETLLAQGRAGASTEDIQRLMEEHLGGLDRYWIQTAQPEDEDSAEREGSPQLVPEPVGADRTGSDMHNSRSGAAGLPVVAPASQTRTNSVFRRTAPHTSVTYQSVDQAATPQGLYQSSTYGALVPTAHVRSATSRRPLTPPDHQVDACVSSAKTAPTAMGAQSRNYVSLPALSPAVVPAQAYITTNTITGSASTDVTKSAPVTPPLSGTRASVRVEEELRGHPGKQSAASGVDVGCSRQTRQTRTRMRASKATTTTSVQSDSPSRLFSLYGASLTAAEAALPEWHGACRDAVYSLLHIRLEEAVVDAGANGMVSSSEPSTSWQSRQARMLQDIANARERQWALDASTLATMDPSAYAALDVALDGNSTCVSRRTQSGRADDRVKIMSQSRALCVQRAQQSPQAPTPVPGVALARARGGGAQATSQRPHGTSSRVSAPNAKARRVAAQHHRMVAQEQLRRQKEEEQGQRRHAGLDDAPAWW